MKKYILFSLLSVIALGAVAQPKVGLTFGPSLSLSRVKFKADDGDITNDGSAARFRFGLELDLPVGASESYVFSTGLIYTPKRAGFRIEDPAGNVTKEDYRLQYLQLPLTLKLYVREIQPDLTAYFQLGFLAEFKLFSEPIEDDFTLIKQFRFFDTSFVFGAGVEYGAGVSSVIYGGLFYNRGLMNIVQTTQGAGAELTSKLDMLGLQVGLKF